MARYFSIGSFFLFIPSLMIGLIFCNDTFYDFRAKDIKTGGDVAFSQYKGKVVLIVNVASECGYTVESYEKMVELQKQYKRDKFIVLAFPCNQFGEQEPKENTVIWRFVDERFQLNFDLFQKIEVIGEEAHPLYKWLKEQTKEEPTWNFDKYLLNQQGEVVRFAPAWVSPKDLKQDIADLIAGKELEDGLLKHEAVVEESPKHQEL